MNDKRLSTGEVMTGRESFYSWYWFI